MSKSLVTNLLAALVAGASLLLPPGEAQAILRSTGLYALSGALTNWLAVHMLFERVPLLYGSGVITNRFEEFKAGIRRLVMTEFFSRQHIERLLKEQMTDGAALNAQIDWDRVFEGLVHAIQESPLGGMLGMIGGAQALQPLKQPVIAKLQHLLAEVAENVGKEEGDAGAALMATVERMVDNRLDELTPQMVKQIIQDMIRQHLGWLVVWGGVFGGLIGALVALGER